MYFDVIRAGSWENAHIYTQTTETRYCDNNYNEVNLCTAAVRLQTVLVSRLNF